MKSPAVQTAAPDSRASSPVFPSEFDGPSSPETAGNRPAPSTNNPGWTLAARSFSLERTAVSVAAGSEPANRLADHAPLDHPYGVRSGQLFRGEIRSFVAELESLLANRRTRERNTLLNYFRTHGLKNRRMDYATSRVHQTPIGSRAVESAIRRVINLGVKSNSTYWLRQNAETMIRLRAWLKAGRAEELFRKTTYVKNDLVA